MNKTLLGIICVIAVSVPAMARADVISYKEAWAFLYDFPLSYSGGTLASAKLYSLTTGEAPEVPVGDWTLTIVDGRNRILATHLFDPKRLAVGGRFDLVVPYFDDGTTARFVDASGRHAFEIDLRGSRVCDDNGICASGVGENADTCPSDCGATAVSTPANLSASIGQSVSAEQEIGAWVLRLSWGAAGFMLLAGVARMLDRRKGA